MDHLVATHSILRWVVLLFGLYALTKAYRGMKRKQDYTANHRRSSTIFLSTLHLQALIGIVLYFSKDWHNNLGKAFADMGNSYLRFFAIEHIFGMLVAVVLIQVGLSKVKRTADVHLKHKRTFNYILIGLLIILATIPWPFRETIGRALWPEL